MNYKQLYKLENGVLIRNTENKIIYTDENGIKRVKTNPALKDFAKYGIKPVRYDEMPEYNPDTQTLKEKIVEGLDEFVIKYEVEEVENK